MTISNGPVSLLGHALSSFLSKYGSVEEVNTIRGSIGAIDWDYSFLICLKSGGGQGNPRHNHNNWQMRVIVGGRQLNCWSSRQQAHLTILPDKSRRKTKRPCCPRCHTQRRKFQGQRRMIEVARRKKNRSAESNQPVSTLKNQGQDSLQKNSTVGSITT